MWKEKRSLDVVEGDLQIHGNEGGRFAQQGSSLVRALICRDIFLGYFIMLSI